MEGEPGESDEDVQGEERSIVLWEKCFQQSIFVDLSEDESLHLSDLENSLALHLSQAESAASEASIHLSAGSAELSGLDVTSSESSSVSSQSERVVQSKSSILHVSAQRPNTMQDEPPLNQSYEDPGQNTSDEDQDELPYDGDLASPYFNQTANTESSDGRETVHASPDVPDLPQCNIRDRDDVVEHLVSVECNAAKKPAALLQEDTNTKHDNFFDAPKPSDFAPSCPCPADINQLLLRHFSQEELQRSGRLIEAETLPEVSLLESVDDTVFSWAPTLNSTTLNSNHSERSACNSEINQSLCSNEKSNTASQNSTLEEEAERKIDHVTSVATESITSSSASTDSKQSSGDLSAVDVAEQEKAEEDDQVQRVPLVRTRSFSEMKYGQGQVHYPLPDFSKVAPKVKIPKAPSGQGRPVPQNPSTMHRAQSSPGMLEVISRVLEDSVQPSEKPYVFKDEEKTPPALVHHLQAEYDKLLTKYAEAENLIDQMRLGTNTQPSSDLMLYLECDDDHHHHHQGNLPVIEGSHLGSLTPHLPSSENFGDKEETTPQSNIKEVHTASSGQAEEGPSDGERMTAELRDIISQFMQKVEDFKLSVSIMSVSTAEQQMMLRSIMEAQDQLERKYISKKEEHRALEMQNYMGLSRNTGTFDPNRLVEGDIFRIGMHLEDIKEMIDKNVCEQISPPHSSSTPTSMKEMLHAKPSPLCMPTPSPPPSLHEGPSAGFSIVGYKTEVWREEEKEEEEVEASEVHGDDGLQHSSRSQGSLDGRDIQRAEAEEERSSVLSEVIDHSNILAYLSGASSSSRRRQQTPDSCSTPDSVLNPVVECDLGDCVSLAVEVSSSSDAPRDSDTHSLSEPPLNTSSVSQRIVSPETDSGFGSSYLNQSASGSFQPNLTESLQSQNDALSSSDSEGSCSNLQTAIHPANPTSQRWSSSHPSVQIQSSGAAAAVERWVESTTKEPSVRLQGSERSPPPRLHHHMSEPLLSTSMDTDERGSPYSCSCNSEAILVLQSEVSRLKKDLEEGLVQLPHLAQKMDYLTSKYRQDRQERRSKTRPRSYHRPACNSVLKPSSSRQNVSNLNSSQVRVEDWISSDMDPSKSKGTDSGDTAGSDIMLQFHNSPVGCRKAPEFQHKLHGAQQSSRGSEGDGSGKTTGLTSSVLNRGKEEASDSRDKQRSQKAIMESFYSKERWSLFSSPSLQKPLLQVSYASSSSLPASYKLREPPLQYHHRKRSTQSDTALLPSNVYFQGTLSPISVPSKTGRKTGRRRGSKEEEMNRTLDQAIEVARSMKRTTDRMAKRLSDDLAKAQLPRKLHSMQPLGGRKHHPL